MRDALFSAAGARFFGDSLVFSPAGARFFFLTAAVFFTLVAFFLVDGSPGEDGLYMSGGCKMGRRAKEDVSRMRIGFRRMCAGCECLGWIVSLVVGSGRREER